MKENIASPYLVTKNANMENVFFLKIKGHSDVYAWKTDMASTAVCCILSILGILNDDLKMQYPNLALVIFNIILVLIATALMCLIVNIYRKQNMTDIVVGIII
ncbi:hypothetical protein HZS_5292 [Henneguya salminicola]|nr:hypothetical protein HZS_5292 [Henneguya salminicola]